MRQVKVAMADYQSYVVLRNDINGPSNIVELVLDKKLFIITYIIVEKINRPILTKQ